MKIPTLLPLLCLTALTAQATTRNWTGGGGTTNWSTAANWNPAGAPGDGDKLHIFAANATTRNDQSNLKLDALVIGASTRIVGNPIVLTNGIECGSGVTSEVAVDITLGAYQTWTAFHPSSGALLVTGDINLAGHSLLLRTDTSSAVINLGGSTSANVMGTGNVYVWNTTGNAATGGEVQFSGSVGNGIIGFIQVYPNTRLQLKKTSGHPVNGLLKIGVNSIVQCYFAPQFDNDAEVVIEDGGQLLGGGENHQFAALELQNGAIADSEGGIITVTDNITAYATNATPVINGNLALVSAEPLRVHGPFTPGLTINANIVNGGFAKYNPGLLRLYGTNTFPLHATIAEGVVEAYSATAFGSTAAGVSLSGGSLILRGVNIGNESLTVNAGTTPMNGAYGSILSAYNNSSWAGTVTLNTNLLVISADTTTFSGAIQGPGGFEASYDTVRFSGGLPNSFDGPTWVHCVRLELNKPAFISAVSTSLIIGGVGSDTSEVRWMNNHQLPQFGDVTLYPNGLARITNYSERCSDLTFTGGRVNLGTSGSLEIDGAATVNASADQAVIDGATTAGGLELASPTSCFVDASAIDCNVAIYSRITAGSINKIGAGILCLYANSSYAGLNTIGAGELYIHHNGALGSATAGTVVSNGASLTYSSSVSNIVDRVVLNGIGAYGPNYGALYISNTTTNQGQVSLGSSASIGVDSGGHFYIPSVMDGTGDLTKMGSGTLTLNGVNANTYLGHTYVNRGLMQLSKGGQVAIPNHVTIGTGLPAAASATLRYLAGSSSAVVGNFTVNETGLLDFNGQSESFSLLGVPITLNGGGDVWLGGGTLTYPQGSVTIVEPGTSGASTIGNPTNTGSILLPASIFANTHMFAVNAASSPSGPELSIYANLEASSGTAHVIKSGAGTMRLSGNNTYAGQLAVTAGEVTLASSTAAGAPGAGVLVNSNAVLSIDGNLAIENEPLTINSTAPVQLSVVSGGSYWNSTITLNRNTVLDVASGADLDIYYGFSGTGTLTKTGSGTLQLRGSVGTTDTNTITVAAGTLILDTTPSVQAINGPLVIGDGVGGMNADIVDIARVRQIANTVPVTINSSGLLKIESGLSDAFGSLSGNGNIQFLGSNDLEVGLDDGSSTFSGVISGSGNFWKHGLGTLTLSGNNTHTGFTLVEGGGKLIVNGTQTSSTVIVSNAATLGGTGTVGSITAYDGIVSPGTSAGILNCAAFTANSSASVRIELNGLSPGGGYDQLNVNSTVNLGNTTLSATLGFASAVSNTFTVLNKNAPGPIIGTFNGLPQNATFNISGIPFRISYTGGNGNDVVLTQLLPPPALGSMMLTGASLRLSWPSNYTGFILESKTNLNNGVWTVVTPPPTLSGTNYVATNSTSGPQGFFRLRAP